jgi:hypothetical protein
MGPVEDFCPAGILDQLTEPSNQHACEWRRRCRARVARSRPRQGQLVIFAKPLQFTNGDTYGTLTFLGGSRFRSADGTLCHIPSWRTLDYSVEP